MKFTNLFAATLTAVVFSAPSAMAETRQAVVFEVIPVQPVRQQVNIPPLLGPNDLAELMGVTDPYIIDIRAPASQNDLFSYGAGHIPGAVNAPYGQWRGLWSDPLSVPTDAQITDLVQSFGLTRDRPIVLVHSSAARGNFGSAAFVYWILKSADFENIAILNGGIRGWEDIGGALTQDVTEITRSDVTASLNDTWLATHEDVDAVLDGTSHAQLLDARPLHQIMETASLDGSFVLDAHDLISGEDATAAGDQSIFMRIKQADLDWEYQEVITYCNNGALAAVDWFMASEIAEIPNVRMYAHSLNARQKAQSLWNSATSSDDQ